LHTLEDIEKINKEHYIRAGLVLTEGGHNSDPSTAKRAEECFSEGLTKLKSLKLSAYDRQNIRLLRNAYELGVKFTRELQRGRFKKAEQLAEKSAQYAHRYNAIITARADKL